LRTGRVKRVVLTVVGVLAILLGLLWVGQGLNLIGGSVMTGDPKWFVIGAVVAIVGVLLIIVARGRSVGRP
jgi:hypothetical protein